MNKKQNKGITLVALVITIIVLIILAGVSINAVMNGGIITNAKESKNEYEESKKEEEKKLSQLELSEAEIDFLSKGVPYTLNKKYLTGVKNRQKAIELKKVLNKYGYELYSADDEIIQETDETTLIYTGMIVKEINNDVEVAKVVLFGDVDGSDGLDSTDAVYIETWMIGSTSLLTDITKAAADVNHDGNIDYSDSELIRAYLIGEYIIEQNVQANIAELKYRNDIIKEKLEKINVEINFKNYGADVKVSGINLNTTIEELNNNEYLTKEKIVVQNVDGAETGLVTTGSKFVIPIYTENTTLEGTITAAIVIFGDVDKDGQITQTDLTEMKTLLTQSAGKTRIYGNSGKSQLMACDINGDGDLTIEDYNLLESYITNNETNKIEQNRKVLLLVKDWSTWESLVF